MLLRVAMPIRRLTHLGPVRTKRKWKLIRKIDTAENDHISTKSVVRTSMEKQHTLMHVGVLPCFGNPMVKKFPQKSSIQESKMGQVKADERNVDARLYGTVLKMRDTHTPIKEKEMARVRARSRIATVQTSM